MQVIFCGKIFVSDSMVKLGATVKFSNKAELYFSVKCEQSGLSNFLVHLRRVKKEVSLGGL